MNLTGKPKSLNESIRPTRWSALRITLIYALAGGLWILFSDQAAAALSPNSATLLFISTYKGMFYILVTAALLYIMIRHDIVAITESEEKFAKIFYASPVPVSITRISDGRYIDVNESFLQRMGYQRHEVLGRTALEIGAWVEPEKREATRSALNNSKTLRNFEAHFRTKSGEVGTAILFREVIELQGQKHFIGTTLDITERKQAEEALTRAYDATIKGWSRAMDLRDKETEGHTQRVTNKTLELAARMGIEHGLLEHYRRGALLHDIGKIGVPDRILLKPDKLTPDEWEVMRLHPTLAYEMLMPIEFLRPALDIPYCHHERWDGSGYPRGLKGIEIPLVARIFAVVDVYDALTSDRPYRAAWEKERVLEYLRQRGGQDFDPEIVTLFLAMERGLDLNAREAQVS